MQQPGQGHFEPHAVFADVDRTRGNLTERAARHQRRQVCVGERDTRLARDARRRGAELGLRREPSLADAAFDVLERDSRSLEAGNTAQLSADDAAQDGARDGEFDASFRTCDGKVRQLPDEI